MFEEEKEENFGQRRRDSCFHFSEPSNYTWEDFYDPSVDTHVNTSRTVTENSNVFVGYVLFENFSQQGVIRISNPNDHTKVLVSTSSFLTVPLQNKEDPYIFHHQDHLFNTKSVIMNLNQMYKDLIHVFK